MKNVLITLCIIVVVVVGVVIAVTKYATAPDNSGPAASVGASIK